jgi:hypothetical protein
MVVRLAPGRTAEWHWDEWVIRGSIILLLAIGVAAIWGKPIGDWVTSLGGGTSNDAGGAETPRSPAGGTL